jgi:prolyl-tRNA synthetase
MRQTQLFGATRRSVAQGEESVNAALLTRGGYIAKTGAGISSYLPLGLRVIEKIKQIVREELNQLPATQELLMTALQPKELWEETGRWSDPGMGEIMYRVEETSLGLGASHEENVVDLFRTYASSYRDLPLGLYQIQTKFRKELRAKSGLLRGREFLMKDLYSFHVSDEDLDQYYEQVAAAYLRIFTRCGLEAIRTEALGGVFSQQHSDEFQVINPVGEDTIYLNQQGTLAWNKEIIETEDDPKLIEWSGGTVRPERATEVGNIFRLGSKYSTPMQAMITLEDGTRQPVIMGCYGIGISRLMGVVAELVGQLEPGKLPWPASLAPFRVHLLDLTRDTDSAHQLYKELVAAGIEVLFDDRTASAGEKFADADLIGSTVRIIVSSRSLEAGGAEVVWQWNTESDNKEIVPISELVARLQAG